MTAHEPILAYDDDQTMLRDACRSVLEREVPATALRAALIDRGVNHRRYVDLFAELGWTGVALPENVGGMGFGLRELSVLAEEFGRALVPAPFLTSSVFAGALAGIGAAHHAALLAMIVDGRAIGTYSIDVDATTGRIDLARPSGSTTARLNGTRSFVADAEGATHLLIHVTESGRDVACVVPLDAPGVSVRPMVTVDLLRSYAEITFADVEIAVDGIIDDPDSLRVVTETAMVVQCAESVGAAHRLLELTVDYVSKREQFGRTIASFQAIKHRLADMRIRIESSRVAMRYAAWAVAGDRPDSARAVHVAGLWCGDSCSWVASEAVQLHGGVGFTWEHDVHLFLRRLKANELTLGSPEWHSRRIGEWCVAGAATLGASRAPR